MSYFIGFNLYNCHYTQFGAIEDDDEKSMVLSSSTFKIFFVSKLFSLLQETSCDSDPITAHRTPPCGGTSSTCSVYIMYPGNFMPMKTRLRKKLIRTKENPVKMRSMRDSLFMLAPLLLSRMINPQPPIVKRKLAASPSIMY